MNKKLVIGEVLFAALLLTVGCGNAGSVGSNSTSTSNANSASQSNNKSTNANGGRPITLTFTYWGSPLERANVKSAVKNFQKKYPNIHVKAEYIPSSQYQAKLTTLLSGNILPDVGYMPMPLGMKWASQGKMVNLQTFMKADPNKNFAPENFLAKFDWAPHKTLGFSMQNHALFYNKEAFKKAGIKVPPDSASNAWSWKQFVHVAQELTIDDHGKNATQAGFDPNHIRQYGVYFQPDSVYMNFVYENNGSFLSKDGKTWVLDKPAATQAIQDISDLINKYHVAPPLSESKQQQNMATPLVSGQAAMTFDGQWVLLDLGKSKLNFGIGVLPKLKKSVTDIVGGPMVMFKTSKHKQAAWDFVKFMRTPSTNPELFVKGLWMPYTKSWYTDPKKRSQWVKGPAHPKSYVPAIVNESLNHGYLDPSFYVKNLSAMDQLINPALDEVWLGKKSASKVLQAIAQKVQKDVQGEYIQENY